jgi:hypothetical protein
MPNLCLGLVFIGLITTSDRSGAGEVYSTVQYTGKYVPKSGSPYALCNIDSNKKNWPGRNRIDAVLCYTFHTELFHPKLTVVTILSKKGRFFKGKNRLLRYH